MYSYEYNPTVMSASVFKMVLGSSFKQIVWDAGRNPIGILNQSTARFITLADNTEAMLNRTGNIINKRKIW